MRRLLVMLSMVIITFFAGTFVFWGLGCACEGPNRFARVNPFQDRAPERASQKFFREISSAQCDLDDALLCSPALKNGRIVEWNLVARETKAGAVILYYDARYQEPAGSRMTVSLTVQPYSSGWQIVSCNGY